MSRGEQGFRVFGDGRKDLGRNRVYNAIVVMIGVATFIMNAINVVMRIVNGVRGKSRKVLLDMKLYSIECSQAGSRAR
jgi:hypothetical protein